MTDILGIFSGSASIRSPTENSIASLVSAAAIVKAKSEIEGECHTSAGELHACILSLLRHL